MYRFLCINITLILLFKNWPKKYKISLKSLTRLRDETSGLSAYLTTTKGKFLAEKTKEKVFPRKFLNYLGQL